MGENASMDLRVASLGAAVAAVAMVGLVACGSDAPERGDDRLDHGGPHDDLGHRGVRGVRRPRSAPAVATTLSVYFVRDGQGRSRPPHGCGRHGELSDQEDQRQPGDGERSGAGGHREQLTERGDGATVGPGWHAAASAGTSARPPRATDEGIGAPTGRCVSSAMRRCYGAVPTGGADGAVRGLRRHHAVPAPAS